MDESCSVTRQSWQKEMRRRKSKTEGGNLFNFSLYYLLTYFFIFFFFFFFFFFWGVGVGWGGGFSCYFSFLRPSHSLKAQKSAVHKARERTATTKQTTKKTMKNKGCGKFPLVYGVSILTCPRGRYCDGEVIAPNTPVRAQTSVVNHSHSDMAPYRHQRM